MRLVVVLQHHPYRFTGAVFVRFLRHIKRARCNTMFLSAQINSSCGARSIEIVALWLPIFLLDTPIADILHRYSPVVVEVQRQRLQIFGFHHNGGWFTLVHALTNTNYGGTSAMTVTTEETVAKTFITAVEF